MGSLSAEDRFALATLVKWASDPQFLAGDLSIVAPGGEPGGDLRRGCRATPTSRASSCRCPARRSGRTSSRSKLQGKRLASVSEIPAPALAKMSAGLSRINLDRILTEATEREVRITPELLKEKKKEIIQAECHGLLEFIEPVHTLDSVAGHGRAKEMLRQAAAALKKGRIEVLPMGYCVSGPVGTGKTFLATCFAGEIGIPCVKFLNFRSQWQGVTEANLEKIFNLLKALWPVAVMVDEADAFLGNREASGDSGTSSRVFASIASFMGNTEYRGKIVWFLLTARPDLLPVDLKRQGRAEEHLALFYPQSDAERDELARVVAKKVKVPHLPSFAVAAPQGHADVGGGHRGGAGPRRSSGRWPPDARSRPRTTCGRWSRTSCPPSYPLEIELQNLAAVQECTSRELLPEVYRTMERDSITRRIRELKLLLEER